MYNHLLYFSYWIVNSFVISLFHYLYPNDFILGNFKLSALDASIYSGFWIAFVVWTFWDFAMAKEIKLNGIKTGLWFWMANIVGIWITARLNNLTGFGISYFYLVVILGFFTNLLQRVIRKFVTKNL